MHLPCGHWSSLAPHRQPCSDSIAQNCLVHLEALCLDPFSLSKGPRGCSLCLLPVAAPRDSSPWLLPVAAPHGCCAACLRVDMHDVFALPPLDGLLQFRAILNKVARTL